MFERFTDRPRRVLVLAQEEARRLSHPFIGTEHLLLGLVAEGEGTAAKALESLDISLEQVRQEVEEILGPVGYGAPTGSPPFTPRAKKVLELSLREALQMGHTYIGTEHILLGIVREGEGVAAQVLVNLGADLARVRQKVIELLSGYTEAESSISLRRTTSRRVVSPVQPLGTEHAIRVVHPGRTPNDFTAAYDELTKALSNLVDDPARVLDRVIVYSVPTGEGPGLELLVVLRPEDLRQETKDEPPA